MNPNIKKNEDGIYYVEVASIKFSPVGDVSTGPLAIVPPFKLKDFDVGAIEVKSFDQENLLDGIYKYKNDIFRFIFVNELRNEFK